MIKMKDLLVNKLIDERVREKMIQLYMRKHDHDLGCV